MKENMIVIRDSKTFYFHFDWPKNFDENLKHQNDFIIKSNEYLAENKWTWKIAKQMNHINLILACHKD